MQKKYIPHPCRYFAHVCLTACTHLTNYHEARGIDVKAVGQEQLQARPHLPEITMTKQRLLLEMAQGTRDCFFILRHW